MATDRNRYDKLCRQAVAMKGWVEINSRILTVILAAISFLSATIIPNVWVAAATSMFIIMVQVVRRDSFSIGIGSDDWERVKEGYRFTYHLAPGFRQSPCLVFKKSEDGWKLVWASAKYSERDGKETLEVESSEPFEGCVTFGGPMGA